jgi:DNA-binding IclR family transcriptional regulator
MGRSADATPGRQLTGAQQRVLAALVDLCWEPGSETTLAEVVRVTGLAPGAAKQALQGLERRRCAEGHDEGGAWSLLWTGRDRSGRFDR